MCFGGTSGTYREKMYERNRPYIALLEHYLRTKDLDLFEDIFKILFFTIWNILDFIKCEFTFIL